MQVGLVRAVLGSGLQSLQGRHLCVALKGGKLHCQDQRLLKLERVVLLIERFVLLRAALQECFEGRDLKLLVY